jgi:putative copper export protein/mono/diheme cytochrome c family protein
MESLLVAARAVHFAAAISLAGTFTFLSLVVSAQPSPRLERQFAVLAWTSLMLAFASGLVWLLLVAAQMSGAPLGSLSRGIIATVLDRTRFGQVWLMRFGLAVAMALVLLAPRHRRGTLWRLTGLFVAFGFLVSLAWAGHGAATPGSPGELHLAADMLHLLAAGAWVGSLVPLVLFLAETGKQGEAGAATARRAVRRFSLLAAISVVVLLVGGLINTWFLAGSVPALLGTLYGWLLLAKIAIFATMVTVGAVNLLRMSPRLAVSPTPRGLPAIRAALDHLRRNAGVEAGLGLGVLVIVAILGILPPGLHTEPGWPLPFRFEPASLAASTRIVLTVLALLAAASLVAAVATAAAGRYRRMMVALTGLVLCLGLGWIVARPAVAPAYPTTFYAPAAPYAAASIARGARLYAQNCALCHGAGGRGDGPAAAGLAVHPADLTAPHLFAHTPGDLYWWVSHGKADGAMPGFAGILRPTDRWDTINFVRARAAGLLSRQVGAQLSLALAPEVPDFAFEIGDRQHTLSRTLPKGPVLLVLLDGLPAPPRLGQLAAVRQPLAAAGLSLVAVVLGPPVPASAEAASAPGIATVAPEVAAALALFRDPADGSETDLLLDRAGEVRARWTANSGAGLPDIPTLAADARRVARLPTAAQSHAGHVH